jgi:hypothetical protein
MSMGGRRWLRLGYGAIGVLAVVLTLSLAQRALPGARVGDIDPLGAVFGLLALTVSAWAGRLSVRALRWQEIDVATAAGRLAEAVLAAEQDARCQLLGDHDKTVDVEFDFRPAPAHDAAGAAPVGHLEEVVAYYRELRPGRMVITGAPGAGKTVLAVELMLGLLEDRTPWDPVPVRLSVAAWDTDQPVEAWLAEHLAGVYRMPPATARALVAARRVLPVLDGLDEMDSDPAPGYASRAGQALRTLNAYQYGRGKAEMVLTCRSGQYQALEAMRVWAQDATHVEIRPVGAGKAREFLTRRISDLDRWQEVLQAFDGDPSGPLAQGLSTPWRLTLAVTIYEQRDPRTGVYLHDPQTLLAPDLDTPTAVGDHLLGLFIPSATALHPHPKGDSYAPERVHAWLAVLATYLHHNAVTERSVKGRPLSGTDVVLHELWPLAGPRRPRAVHAAMIAGMWVVSAVAMLMQVPISLSPLHLLPAAMWVLITLWTTFVAWDNAWPPTTRADLNRLRTRTGWRRSTIGFVTGLGSGLVVGFQGGVAFGVTVGFAVALGVGLATGLTTPGTIGARDPRDLVRADFTFGLAFGFSAGLAAGLAVGLAGLAGGLAFTLACGLANGPAVRFTDGHPVGIPGGIAGGTVFGLIGGGTLGLIGGMTAESAGGVAGGLTVCFAAWFTSGFAGGPISGLSGGLAGLRYVALLLCTRRWSGRWLPWRLGRFLNWCYGATLIRVAGNAYQFRHRELQDYLARNPIP